MYLRDTAIIQHQYVDALLAALQEVMDLIGALPKDVIALSTITEGTDDLDMHKYAKWTKRLLVHNEQLFTFNVLTNYPSKMLRPQLADTSQPHLVTVPLAIEVAYRACNNWIAHSHLVPVQSLASHEHWMPTSWNSEFQQQDRVEANRTAPIVWIHCTIYHRAHQILQRYVCGVPRML
jgi:hypothetical protein